MASAAGGRGQPTSDSAHELLLIAAGREYASLLSRRCTSEAEASSAAAARLDAAGESVGRRLAELRAVGKPRVHTDALEVVKMLCKELWTAAFGKAVDNLKTNHRGVFVLHDATFRPLHAVSADAPLEVASRGQEVGGAPVYVATPESVGSEACAAATRGACREQLHFSKGLVRGALDALGLIATVAAEAPSPPAVTFTVKVTQQRSRPQG